MIDYLAKYYKKTKDKKVNAAIKKSTEFLSYFLHPNLTSGGEYGSRNTEYLIPHGIEFMAKQDKNASIIAAHIRQSIVNQTSISPTSLDDRYLTYISYCWLQAHQDISKLKTAQPRYKSNFQKDFTKAHIYIISNNAVYLILNYAKSSFKLFSKKGKHVIYDAGILVKTKNQKLSSGFLNYKNKVKLEKNKIIVNGNMGEIKTNLLDPKKNILLRGFQLTLGKNKNISLLTKKILRKKLITKEDSTPVKFKREIEINKNIKIVDTIKSPSPIKKIYINNKFSYTYIPSSRLFQISELNNKPISFNNKGKREIRITRSITKNNQTYTLD